MATSTPAPPARARLVGALWLLLDLAMVAGFVVLGQAEHEDDDPSGFVEIAAPFVIALVIGWIVTRAWRQPLAWRTGIGVWAITVAVGMVLRRTAFDDGTAAVFVIVTAAFLALTMLGWRFVAKLITGRLDTRR